MSRVTRLSLVPALLAFLSASAVAEDGFRVISPKEDRAVAVALAAPTRPDLSGTLRSVLDDLADFHRVGILIDEQAIAEQGRSIDGRVDLDAAGLDLSTTLRRLLEPHGLTHVVEDGVLKVTTGATAARTRLVRAYDVAPLLDHETTAEEVGKAVILLAETLASEEGVGPPQVVPFKTLLIVVGNPGGHERVERALEIMSQVEEE
ncbi:MAG TPA: hypothetical protein VF170_06850 [Planctomycetaceae bacterium]